MRHYFWEWKQEFLIKYIRKLCNKKCYLFTLHFVTLFIYIIHYISKNMSNFVQINKKFQIQINNIIRNNFYIFSKDNKYKLTLKTLAHWTSIIENNKERKTCFTRNESKNCTNYKIPKFITKLLKGKLKLQYKYSLKTVITLPKFLIYWNEQKNKIIFFDTSNTLIMETTEIIQNKLKNNSFSNKYIVNK